jgi:polyhydroxyalkanoate synthesis repressor PhaR
VHRNRGERPVEAEKVVIKKYGNRRLYDTFGSRYVNLEDIAGLVRNGKDVQVLDAKTGEDLTRVILTQIILEDAKGQPTGLPLELLRQLVVATDSGRDFLMVYLKSAFEAYHKVHDSVQSRLSEVQAAALSPLQTVRKLVKRDEPNGPVRKPAGPFPKNKRTGHPTELDRLRERIAELEARVGKPAPRPKKRKRAKRSK